MAGLAASTALGWGLDAALRPYSQIVFSRSRVSGALILLAIATAPGLALDTLIAVAVAQLLVWLTGFGLTAIRDGGFASAAVLTTLALGYGLGEPALAIVVAGAVLSVILCAALRMLLSGGPGAPLSLPFVASAWLMLLASRVLPEAPVTAASASPFAAWAASLLPGSTWLGVPAAILFLPSAVAGLLLLLAIVWHSRIAGLLAAIGAVAAALTRLALRGDAAWSDIDLTASFNAMLTAMALGGVWFVPHPSSMLLAAAGAVLTCLLTYALSAIGGLFTLPLLSLPFAVTTLATLYAMRLREHDRRPASAPLANRPEDALAHHLMRVRRFGEFAWLPFRLPFRGPWLVSQGHNGAHTHKGPWRYALDFEIARPEGDASAGDGRDLTHYPCYGLPVLAAGTGTVEQVIDGVPDNPVNGVNARDNWGNVVIIAHGPNLYSASAHLQPRSIRVKPGDFVKAGAEIGRCGNSGRSLVPHVHFQVQRGAVMGSETIPVDFGDVVSRRDGRAELTHRVIPAEGTVVRPVVRDEAIAQALAFTPGSEWQLAEEGGARHEAAEVEIDLWGRRVLRSPRGRLYLEPYQSGLIIVAFEGERDSLLALLHLAMARVPFDQEGELMWQDRVPRDLVWPGAALLISVAAVVAPRLTDLEIRFTSKRTERAVVIAGDAGALKTHATVSLGGEPHLIEVERGGQRTRLRLILGAGMHSA